MPRRVGRYTKQETAELLRLYEEGNSIYKICRTINRSQKSIRNNLIRLGKMKGEITPRRYVVEGKDVVIEDKIIQSPILYFICLSIIWFLLIFIMIINPHLNPLTIIASYISDIYYLFQ